MENRIGEDGKGFRYILDSLNPERILNAAEVRRHRAALRSRRRWTMPSERVVFGRPIGKNQSIQHPLAECWSELSPPSSDAACGRALRCRQALRRTGQRREISRRRRRASRPCDQAIRTHGGMGYAAEFHVERYFREMVAMRLAPVSREMILYYIAERELGLPKSY